MNTAERIEGRIEDCRDISSRVKVVIEAAHALSLNDGWHRTEDLIGDLVSVALDLIERLPDKIDECAGDAKRELDGLREDKEKLIHARVCEERKKSAGGAS